MAHGSENAPYRSDQDLIGGGSGRVVPGHCCPGTPSEPGVRLSPHRAQAGPKDQGHAEPHASVTSAVRDRLRQSAWTSRNATDSSGVPCPCSAVIGSLRTALRVTRSHCSHSSGLCGSWSASSKNASQSGQRPCCVVESQPVV